MQEILEKLKDNLERQTSLYHKIGDLAERKQKALLANNLPVIDSITKQEEKLILDAGTLEEERLAWAEKMAQVMNKPAEELTLNELSERFPELEPVRVALEQAIGRLKDIHKVNTRLLEQAVEIVNLTLDVLTQPTETTYAKPGKDNTPQKQVHILDRSI